MKNKKSVNGPIGNWAKNGQLAVTLMPQRLPIGAVGLQCFALVYAATAGQTGQDPANGGITRLSEDTKDENSQIPGCQCQKAPAGQLQQYMREPVGPISCKQADGPDNGHHEGEEKGNDDPDMEPATGAHVNFNRQISPPPDGSPCQKGRVCDHHRGG